VGAFCAAKRAQATISLPYYLATPRADNPLAPVNEFMTAACDSGIVLASAPAEALAGATPGPNHALCSAVGLADLGLDPARNLTKFSPVPQAKGRDNGNETLDVQITIPDPMVAGALGYDISEPEAGWPVAILFHGITSQKEDMLAISGALSLAGVATVAIDQPLHGSRGFDLDGDTVDDLNATTVSATHYMNLASLPTARDNSRQAISDLLGLRLGLNAVVDTTSAGMVNLDKTNVSIMGVSLGAINGGNFAAVANQSMGGDLAALDGMFAIKTASLESPGAGIASFLLESNAFSPLIKALLLSESSPDFQNFLAATYGDAPYTEAQQVAAVTNFLAALSAEQLAGVNAVFSQFIFAAQTVLDATDPINYVQLLASNTPSHVMTVVGDGGDNLPDQVIPVSTAVPLAGQTAYVNTMGIDQVSASIQSADPVSGYVLFNEGAHGSSLNPGPSGATTLEMQSQVASFIASGGRLLPITNTAIVVD
jgi:Pla-1/cef family extracellular lipase